MGIPQALPGRGSDLSDQQSAHADPRRGRRVGRSRACPRELSTGTRPAHPRNSNYAADLSRRRQLVGQESLAREKQGERRIKVAAEIRRNLKHRYQVSGLRGWLLGVQFSSMLLEWK